MCGDGDNCTTSSLASTFPPTPTTPATPMECKESQKQRWLLTEVPPPVWEEAIVDRKTKWNNPAKPPRKNPRPMRSPDRKPDPHGVRLTCAVFEIYKRNPRALLQWEPRRPRKTRCSINHPSVLDHIVDKTRPAPPPMLWDDLIGHLDDLEIDNTILDSVSRPVVTWRGEPTDVSDLPHFEDLHPVERQVISILRMTPEQYMQTKYVILSAAREYLDNSLPFRKVDAQRVVRIDVSKACKLWEFFRQVGWL